MVFSSASSVSRMRQPELRARLDVVRKRLVDDVETERAQLALDPRQPDVARGAAAVAVNQDRLDRRHAVRCYVLRRSRLVFQASPAGRLRRRLRADLESRCGYPAGGRPARSARPWRRRRRRRRCASALAAADTEWNVNGSRRCWMMLRISASSFAVVIVALRLPSDERITRGARFRRGDPWGPARGRT